MLSVLLSPSVDSMMLMLASAEIISFIILISKAWYHIIMMTIILEFFTLKAFLLMALAGPLSSTMVLFFFAVFMVSEASLGLSLVVGITRSWGDGAIMA